MGIPDFLEAAGQATENEPIITYPAQASQNRLVERFVGSKSGTTVEINIYGSGVTCPLELTGPIETAWTIASARIMRNWF
jgi:hypothetical protein